MTTNSSMCVFNKFTDENKNVKFKKHLIRRVFWDDRKGVNVNLGHESNDEVRVFIPKSQNDLSGYVSAKHYQGLNNTWTLNNGDFIVRGNVTENEVLSFKELAEKYDNVFKIVSIDDKDFGSTSMHHFEIRGN